MEPTIPLGAAVIVEPVAPADLAVGDIVSLRSGPQRAVFTHRIIRIADRDGEVWIETQGDANDAPDPSITPATAVIGRVAVIIPWPASWSRSCRSRAASCSSSRWDSCC